MHTQFFGYTNDIAEICDRTLVRQMLKLVLSSYLKHVKYTAVLFYKASLWIVRRNWYDEPLALKN